jgi:hypothetical protein
VRMTQAARPAARAIAVRPAPAEARQLPGRVWLTVQSRPRPFEMIGS